MRRPADPWLNLLDRAIQGLNLAAVKLREPGQVGRFRASTKWFCKVQTKGRWRGIRVPREENTSDALCRLFSEIGATQLVEGRRRRAVDLRHIHIAVEQGRVWDPDVGTGSHPTDFRIVVRDDREYDLRIEAKNVLSQADVYAAYLGADGLARFEDANAPYTLERYGAMVAYVADGDAETWARQIGEALLPRLGERRLKRTRTRSATFDTSVHVLEVDLPRIRGTFTVEVVHFVIEVDADPGMRDARIP